MPLSGPEVLLLSGPEGMVVDSMGQVSLTLVRHSKLFKGAMTDNLCAEVRQLTFGIESVIDATQVCGALQLFNCLAVLSAALQVNGFVPWVSCCRGS